MHRFLMVLPLLSLIACEAGPDAGDASRGQPDELMLVDTSLLNLAGLFGIEFCGDGRDNDGDGLVDGDDPDCRFGTLGQLGFIGETVDGTNIDNPFKPATIKTLDGDELVVTYDPGLRERGIPAELVLRSESTGAITAVWLDSGAQVDFVMSGQRREDRDPGLVIGLVDGGGYYAQGPIGDTLYLEGR